MGQRGRCIHAVFACVFLNRPNFCDDRFERLRHRLVHRHRVVAFDEPGA